MILIDSKELMAPGDTFEMRWSDWDKIIRPPMGPTAYSRNNRKITCKVLRVFARSSHEVRYICVSQDDARQKEFVLGQILEDAYQVTATHPTLEVSKMVFVEAAARIGVRSISPEKPTLYTKDETERLAAAIQDVPLKERYMDI